MKISIPQPCHENWQEMTRNERGRFCASCQKTIVDFTGWTDKAVFDFFQGQQGKTCGRFRKEQTERIITSETPRNRAVYRIAIALTAVSLFATPPIIYGQQAVTHQTPVNKKYETKQSLHTNLQGIITGKNDEALADVSIKLFNYQLKQVANTVTNSQGRYALSNLKPDIYSIEIASRDTAYAIHTDNITIKDSEPATFNASLMLKSDQDNFIIGDIEVTMPEKQGGK